MNWPEFELIDSAVVSEVRLQELLNKLRDDNVTDNSVMDVREFRQRAVNCDDLMEYIGIFQQCWDFLARSDVNIGVSLSPRFPTNANVRQADRPDHTGVQIQAHDGR
jgi:hypothetical protein